MGGYGSGPTTWRPQTDHAMPLDFRRVFRSGLHRMDGPAYLDREWRRGDVVTGSISVWFDPAEPDRFQLRYRRNGQDASVRVPIVATGTAGAASGQRMWVRCPHCGRRVAVLWGVAGVFRCRACHQLRYSSQREGEMDRAIRAVERARKAIGPDDERIGYLWERMPPPRPAGMRWSTYDRLLLRLQDAERRCERAFRVELQAIAGRCDRILSSTGNGP